MQHSGTLVEQEAYLRMSYIGIIRCSRPERPNHLPGKEIYLLSCLEVLVLNFIPRNRKLGWTLVPRDSESVSTLGNLGSTENFCP